MKNAIKKFLKEEDGITALEYGVLAAVVVAVIAVAFSQPLTDFFTSVFDTIKTKAGLT